MSANLVVDLNNTAYMGVSIVGLPLLSGSSVFPASGAVIGTAVDMIHANTYCNLFVAGFSHSGQLRVQVQTADATTSGSFTDPTSGLPTGSLPGAFASGGILWINSGATGGGILGAQTSGQSLASGFFVAQGFIRTGRYARAILLSGDFAAGPITVGFVANLKQTGSGGGFTFSPGSGTVSV